MGHFTHFGTFSISCYSTFIYLIGKKYVLQLSLQAFFWVVTFPDNFHYLKNFTFFIFKFFKFNYSFVLILPSHLLTWTSCSSLSLLFHQFLSSLCYKQFNKLRLVDCFLCVFYLFIFPLTLQSPQNSVKHWQIEADQVSWKNYHIEFYDLW